MPGPAKCTFSGCERLAAASLELHPFCPEHFILTCYSELEECNRWLEAVRSSYTTAESVEKFLTECIHANKELFEQVAGLSDPQQARILFIEMWVGDLQHRMKAKPR